MALFGMEVTDKGKAKGAAGGSQAGVAGGLAAAVAGDVRLVRSEHQGSAAFQALGVGFVAVSVIEEDSVAAANGRLAVALGIQGEAHSGSGIDPMVVQTSAGNAGAAALHDAVEKILIVGRIGVGKRDIGDWIEQRGGVRIEQRSVCQRPGIRAEIVLAIVFLVIGAEEAQAQAEVQSELAN